MNLPDYQWAQHTIAEARYSGRAIGVHIQIPFERVQAARKEFFPKDVELLNPHIDLTEQIYQIHLFNKDIQDAWITHIPFTSLKQALGFLHMNPEAREELLTAGRIPFIEFLADNKIPHNPDLPMLHYGHEKYGFFDLIEDDTFLYQQLHRVVLFGAFVRGQGKTMPQDEIQKVLPPSITKYLAADKSLAEAVIDSTTNGVDGNHTAYSHLERLTLIVDGASPDQKIRRIKVCFDHEAPVYWADYRGRIVYRMLNPQDKRSGKIERILNGVEEQPCPKCLAKQPA